MSRIGGHDDDHENCFPRVSGDEPRVYTIEDAIETFSPRERG